MKIGTVLTATDTNPLYSDFIPMFIKAWNKILPNADVKIILVADAIPDKYSQYNNNIILFKPLEGIKTSFITQCIRLLYAREIKRNEGVLLTDMDMIPLNKSFYVDPIKNIDEDTYVVIAAEGQGMPANGDLTSSPAGQIWLCYNVAHPNIWSAVFGNEDTTTMLNKWYNNGNNGWYTDQEQLTAYVNAYKGKKIAIPNSQLKYNRLDRPNTEVFKDVDKLKKDIANGVYSDYHALRPYEEHKEMNDIIVNSIPQYGGRRHIKMSIKKRMGKLKRKSKYKTRKYRGGSEKTTAYVINLDTSTDRWDKIQEEYKDTPIKLERFSAIKHEMGGIGIGKSFQALVQMAKDKNMDTILIMEDDCKPLKHFNKRWPIVKKWLDENRDKWKIFNGGPLTPMGHKLLYDIDNKNKIYTSDGANCAHFMLFSKEAYDTVLEWDWGKHHLVDWYFNKEFRNYVYPEPPLAFINSGKSNINAGKVKNYTSKNWNQGSYAVQKLEELEKYNVE